MFPPNPLRGRSWCMAVGQISSSGKKRKSTEVVRFSTHEPFLGVPKFLSIPVSRIIKGYCTLDTMGSLGKVLMKVWCLVGKSQHVLLPFSVPKKPWTEKMWNRPKKGGKKKLICWIWNHSIFILASEIRLRNACGMLNSTQLLLASQCLLL